MKALFSSHVIRGLHFSISKQHFFINPIARTAKFSLLSNPHSQHYSSQVCLSSSVEKMEISEVANADERPPSKRVLESTEEGSNSDELAKKARKGKKKNKDPVLMESVLKISHAAKHNNRDEAIKCFRSGREKGLHFNQGVMNSVLYLLVGGEHWFENAKTACSQNPNTEKDQEEEEEGELTQWRDEVLEYMQKEDLMTDEMVYTAQARLSVCLGDPDRAFLFIKEMLDVNIPARLRSFTPALLGFAEQGQKTKALEVQNTIDGCNLDLTELEFQLLLKASTTCVQDGQDYANVESLLNRIGNELTYLQSKTIQIARDYFKSQKSKLAFTQNESLSKKETWLINDIEVDSNGYSPFSGDYLSATDLSEEDWNVFLEASTKIAMKNEHKGKIFESFMNWYDRNGPFNFIIDGANVAFHKQNYEAGKFSFAQIKAIVDFIEQRYPDGKPLVILHENRTKGRFAQLPLGRNLLSRLSQNKQLFKTPVGSNDDWYWLYATLKAKGKGLLISNDECRDHIFQLLTPKYFLKWKERHLVRYDFSLGSPSIQMPSHYTPCTQQLSNKTWMLPYRRDDKECWFCAKPS